VQRRLFQAFSQADSSITREYGGSGLGLSIVRRLAELMSGSVGVSSEPGKGSRFYFRVRVTIDSSVVPASASAATPKALTQAKHKDAASGGALALLVDDNPVNRMVAEVMLGELGIEVLTASDGQECLDQLAAGLSPTFIFMDVQMPVMDGLTATRRLREQELATGQPRVPVIALTGGVFADDAVRCQEAGMDDFLAKPISFDLLKTIVDKWQPRGLDE